MGHIQRFKTFKAARIALLRYDPKHKVSARGIRALLSWTALHKNPVRGLFRFRTFAEAKRHAMDMAIQSKLQKAR